jgi:ribosome assembly protein 4
VRFWDLNTETPQFTGTEHKNWVLYTAWSPDGLSRMGAISQVGLLNLDPGRISNRWLCRNPKCSRLVSASKDKTVRVWDVINKRTLFTLAGHTAAVTCVRWGGNGFTYTGSQDKSIMVWSAESGKLVKTLQGHAHWVSRRSMI